MNEIKFTRRERILYITSGCCYWCGCVLDTENKYQSNSYVESKIIPEKKGGRNVLSNLVPGCFTCVTHIKKDFYVEGMQHNHDLIRQYIHEARRASGLRYDSEYVTTRLQTLPKCDTLPTEVVVPLTDVADFNDARFMMLAEQTIKDTKRQMKCIASDDNEDIVDIIDNEEEAMAKERARNEATEALIRQMEDVGRLKKP